MSILKVKCYLFALFVFWKMCLPYMKQFELSDPLINKSILIHVRPTIFKLTIYRKLLAKFKRNTNAMYGFPYYFYDREFFVFFSIKHLFQKQVGLLTQILIKSWIYIVTIVSDIIIPPWNIRITENSSRPSPQPDFRQKKLSLGPPPPPSFEKYLGKLVYILQSSTCVTIVIYFDL